MVCGFICKTTSVVLDRIVCLPVGYYGEREKLINTYKKYDRKCMKEPYD